MRTITNFFLANLAVADFCVGIFCILQELYKTFSSEWVLGKVRDILSSNKVSFRKDRSCCEFKIRKISRARFCRKHHLRITIGCTIGFRDWHCYICIHLSAAISVEF